MPRYKWNMAYTKWTCHCDSNFKLLSGSPHQCNKHYLQIRVPVIFENGSVADKLMQEIPAGQLDLAPREFVNQPRVVAPQEPPEPEAA